VLLWVCSVHNGLISGGEMVYALLFGATAALIQFGIWLFLSRITYKQRLRKALAKRGLAELSMRERLGVWCSYVFEIMTGIVLFASSYYGVAAFGGTSRSISATFFLSYILSTAVYSFIWRQLARKKSF